MKKRRLSVLLALIMVLSCSATAWAYSAVSEPWDAEPHFVDQVRVKNAKTQAMIEYVYASYGSNDKFFKGRGECYGYAEMIRQYFGSGYRQKSFGVKATPASMYKYLKKLKPGTHVRFAKNRNGSGSAHSIVLLKIDKKNIWYTHGNVGQYNAVFVEKSSLSAFCNTAVRWGYPNLVWAREPKGKLPSVSRPAPKVSFDRNGPEVHIAWRPVSKAKRYIVYRSSSKNGKYKKLATVKVPVFVDRSSDLYGNAYYKVRAVISKRKSLTSKPVKAMRRVMSPRVCLNTTEEEDGTHCIMTWVPVPGAVKYNFYTYDGKKDRYVKRYTVSGTSLDIPDDDLFGSFFITAEGKRKGSESLPEYLDL